LSPYPDWHWGLTQSSLQWVLGAFFLAVKQLGHEADYSLLSSADVKNMELDFHSPCLDWHSA